MDNHILLGNRIPKDYFMTTGKGDSDIGPSRDPWTTGSFMVALRNAGIENFNLLQYTPLLSREAKEISMELANVSFQHGAIMETVMASINGHKGNILCSGIGRIFVRRKSDKSRIGGFAARYEGAHRDGLISIETAEQAAQKNLHTSLMDAVRRRFHPDDYEFYGESHKINAFQVKSRYGTSLTALCWVNYSFPVVKPYEKSDPYELSHRI